MILSDLMKSPLFLFCVLFLHAIGLFQSSLFIFLIGLFPSRGAKVCPLEVVVTAGVVLFVLFHGGRVASKACLAQLEWILTLVHARVARTGRGLEGLISAETRLEVHPIFCSVSEFLLLKRILRVRSMQTE